MPQARYNSLSRSGIKAQVHGLITLSPVLALQIHRFDVRGYRIQFSIENDWKLRLPLFINKGSEVQHLPYKACAIILHTGESVSQGHYCAVLLEEKGVPRFFTNDGKRAIKAKPKDIPLICQRAYLIILKQCNDFS